MLSTDVCLFVFVYFNKQITKLTLFFVPLRIEDCASCASSRACSLDHGPERRMALAIHAAVYSGDDGSVRA